MWRWVSTISNWLAIQRSEKIAILELITSFLEQVLFVAERSQKDPKEYLPFLNELKRHSPPAYRRYKIDLNLKRHKSALKNLSEIHEEHREEVIELIRSQRLYKEGLQYFRDKSQTRREVCRAYGDYLAAKKYYEDAAMIYERGEFWLEGVAAWEKSMNWRMCLGAAQKTNQMAPAEFRYDSWLHLHSYH